MRNAARIEEHDIAEALERFVSPAMVMVHACRDQSLEEAAAYIRSQVKNDSEALAGCHDWYHWAHPYQRIPKGRQWRTWLLMSGRGAGKTRCGSEFVKTNVCGSTPLGRGRASRIGLIAETAADARDVMVEGPAGILACHHPDYRPLYEPSKRRLTWPNGAVATLYNAVEPNQLRGPNHDLCWGDELAKWRYAQDTWDQINFGLRLGIAPQVCVTTTPKGGVKVLRDILADPQTIVTKASTYQNLPFLAPSTIVYLLRKYQGTRLGRQELMAELIDQAERALWTRDMFERNRVLPDWQKPELTPQLDVGFYRRIVVGVDPSISAKPTSSECGIVVCGLGRDNYGYVLEDVSAVVHPAEWGRRAVLMYDKWQADAIIVEDNQGGVMATDTVNQAALDMWARQERKEKIVPCRPVHASRSKYIRAEPIAMLWEQNRCRQLGAFPELEDECTNWEPDSGDESPNRLDAMVHGMKNLMIAMEHADIGMPVAVPKQQLAPHEQVIGPGVRQAEDREIHTGRRSARPGDIV